MMRSKNSVNPNLHSLLTILSANWGLDSTCGILLMKLPVLLTVGVPYIDKDAEFGIEIPYMVGFSS